MFIGKYLNKLDSKGRVAVPAKFRGDLGETVIINKYYTDGCLAIYTEEAWMKKYESIFNQPDNKKDVRDMIRILAAGGNSVQFDTQGRVLIPDELVKQINLTKNCVFIGAGDHVELWPEDGWNAFYASLTDEKIDRIAESL